MKIYVYVNEYNEIVDWHRSISKFKKKYDNILCCPSPSFQSNNLGKKTILKIINEYGYCVMLHKNTFKPAGYLQHIFEGTI